MDFSELGLTKNELKAYEALLKMGKSTASQISQHSGVVYGRIYDTLASLESKGLISVVPDKTKMFIPSDPQKLHDFITKRKASLTSLEEEIIKMKTLYEKHEIEPIQIIRGKNNFYKLVREMKDAKKSEYSIKYSFEFNPEFVRRIKEYKHKKIDYRVIGRFDEETKENIEKWKKIHFNIQPIENEGVAMSLVDEDLLMITMIKSNTSILIRDKPFIKIMKEFFITYYNSKANQSKGKIIAND
ncbi:MAG: helix-turn-helix domain-containing protein [Candidatus Nanoarchaeia archaeon]|nr:helix-turn-helix domain-containing protein [Candidatus Nanoarchaeia archaeon]